MNLNGTDWNYNDLHELLHTLWTKAAVVGGEQYNKAEWKRLEALLIGLWRASGGSTSLPAPGERLSVKPQARRDVHGEWDHSSCPDPAVCICECRACKRAWFDAGRPSPEGPWASYEEIKEAFRKPEEPRMSTWLMLRQPASRT